MKTSGSETMVEINEIKVVHPVPSLMDILRKNSHWKDIYDTVEGGIKGMMTENVIDRFHAHTVEAIDKLDHAGYTPAQIAMETGLSTAKIDAVFEGVGKDKSFDLPDNVRQAYKDNGDGDAVDKAFPPKEKQRQSGELYGVKHDYGCDTDEVIEYGSWDEFLLEWGDAQNHWNLLFRWDWRVAGNIDEEVDPIPTAGNMDADGVLDLYFMKQRKGYHTLVKVCVNKSEELAIRAYLEERWKYVQQLWAPVSGEVFKPAPSPFD